MVKLTQRYGDEKILFDEDVSLSPEKHKETRIHTIKVMFVKNSQYFSQIPTVEINDVFRTVLCNSKVQIGKYNILKRNDEYEIKVFFSIPVALLRIILTKSLSITGLNYQCDNCILVVDGDEKTIFFHY